VNCHRVEKTRRILSLVSALILTLLSSCRTGSDRSTLSVPQTEETISSTPPFQTKEPLRYQALRTITIRSPTGDSITTSVVAKDGEMRRDESDAVGGGKLVYLEIPGGRFMLLTGPRLYADLNQENAAGPDLPISEDMRLESSPNRLLHTEPTEARYKRMGNEVLNGRTVTKYRVVVNSSGPATVNASETLIWVDEDLGIPMKSETTAAGGTRTMTELSKLSLDVDQHLFSIPKDYEKVSPDVIRRRLNQP
jgi:hypothetical protein